MPSAKDVKAYADKKSLEIKKHLRKIKEQNGFIREYADQIAVLKEHGEARDKKINCINDQLTRALETTANQAALIKELKENKVLQDRVIKDLQRRCTSETDRGNAFLEVITSIHERMTL